MEDIWLISQSMLPNLKLISSVTINCGPPSQKKKPSRNPVNVDIYRASKVVFDINLLVPDTEKQDQSGKESSTANDLAILEEIIKEKISEELGPAISSQLAEVAMKYWSQMSKNSVVVNKFYMV